jgi:hypothetical protein
LLRRRRNNAHDKAIDKIKKEDEEKKE